MNYTYLEMAKMIDHSLLNPTLTEEDLERGIQVALDYDVASVCIMPFYLRRCAERLRGSQVNASTTIGFPHGGHTTAIKAGEARQALADGCQELDLVVNISKVLSGDWDYVRADVGAVIEVAHAAGQKVKVIFENCYLNEAQKIRLCEICGELRADWVKTLNGLRDRRRYHGGPGADAPALAGICAGKGGGGRTRPGRAAESARAGRDAGGRYAHGGDAGRMPAAVGRGGTTTRPRLC